MKTDEEIKEFIDGREALTQSELSQFIYGSSRSLSNYRPKWGRDYDNKSIAKWWGYAIKHKDWGKMREYKKYKMRAKPSLFRKERDTIEGVITKFNNELSTPEIVSLLKDKYDVTTPRCLIIQYRKRLGLESKIESNHRKVLILEADSELKKLSAPKASKAFKEKYGEELSKYIIHHYRQGGTKYKKYKKYMGERYIKQRAKKKKVINILRNDERFFNRGCRNGRKLLKECYNIDLHPDTIHNYKKEFLTNKELKCTQKSNLKPTQISSNGTSQGSRKRSVGVKTPQKTF